MTLGLYTLGVLSAIMSIVAYLDRIMFSQPGLFRMLAMVGLSLWGVSRYMVNFIPLDPFS